MKSLLIMKHIDIFTFDLVERFKNHPTHQKLVDEYGVLEEWQQGIVKFILMVLTIVIPAIFLFISFLFYSSKSSELSQYEEYIADSSTIISQTAQLKDKSQAVFGQLISSEGMLNSKMSSILGAIGVDSNNVEVADFVSSDEKDIIHISASIKFKEFTDQNFYAFMKRMLFIENFKVMSFNLEKNNGTNLLQGNLGVAYYSKAPQVENE